MDTFNGGLNLDNYDCYKIQQKRNTSRGHHKTMRRKRHKDRISALKEASREIRKQSSKL